MEGIYDSGTSFIIFFRDIASSKATTPTNLHDIAFLTSLLYFQIHL